MDDSRPSRIIRRRDVTRRRLQAVPEAGPDHMGAGGSPRTIGRLIAQTALIADSALLRRRSSDELHQRTRRFGWFRH